MSDMDRLYKILSDNRATGRFCSRALSDLDTKKALLAEPGIYFFFENGENRTNGSQSRVVRLGITKSNRCLYARLNDHRTDTQVSIFASLVYGAMAYNQDLHIRLQALGVTPQQFCAYLDLNYGPIRVRAGRPVENAMRDFEHHVVLPHMNDSHFSVTWVEVPDPVLRGTLEKCAVSLLSNYCHGAGAIDPPTLDWLGRHSHKPEVQKSGLWNQDYVTSEYSSVPPGWLDSLQQLI